jgi:Domain of unknown function (DUF4440)
MIPVILRMGLLNFAIVLLFISGYGQTKDDLLKTEKIRFKAMQEKDSLSLKNVLADELVYTHSNGLKDGKQSFISSIASGQLQYQMIEIELLDAYTDGNFGWISGKIRLRVKVGTADPVNLHISYLDIYRFQKSQWRMVAWQSARLPD